MCGTFAPLPVIMTIVSRCSSCPEQVFLVEGPTGIEPAFSAWEADVLPLDDGPVVIRGINRITLAELKPQCLRAET